MTTNAITITLTPKEAMLLSEAADQVRSDLKRAAARHARHGIDAVAIAVERERLDDLATMLRDAVIAIV